MALFSAQREQSHKRFGLFLAFMAMFSKRSLLRMRMLLTLLGYKKAVIFIDPGPDWYFLLSAKCQEFWQAAYFFRLFTALKMLIVNKPWPHKFLVFQGCHEALGIWTLSAVLPVMHQMKTFLSSCSSFKSCLSCLIQCQYSKASERIQFWRHQIYAHF